MNADEKRMYKIEKFKREKLAKKRIQEITRFLAIVSKDETVDHEEEQRELYTLTLQSYSRDALDEIDMLEEVRLYKFIISSYMICLSRS